MGKFTVTKTPIEGLVVIEPAVFGDNRGFFLESYSEQDFQEIGISDRFVQDNHSKSSKGVLRGLHFQTQYTQAKLVRVVAGAVLDAVVDLREGSETYGKWFAVELSAENKKMLFVPKGFGHGFLTLEDNTEFLYKCSDYYHPECEGGVMWNDESVGIDWQLERYGIEESELKLSEKDTKYKPFNEIKIETLWKK